MSDTFCIHSKDFHGQVKPAQMFNNFGCTGDNLSPQLEWKHIPEGTESFVITLHDPDAPTPSGFWHWCAFNIPANVTSLERGDSGKMPEGVIETLNDYGARGFGGACPPPGDRYHAYNCTVYALSTDKLDLDESASPAMVCFVLLEHLIEKATITAYTKR